MKNEKRRMKKDNIYLLIICILCVIISGCVSIAENIGKGLAGSSEKIIEKYQSENDIEIHKVINKAKEESILIILNKYPMIKFRAVLPDENGFINIISLEYFGSSVHGWNEFTMVMIGEGNLIISQDAKLENIKDLEKIQITEGKIHRYDTRITGEEAITALHNRYERISAITEWMHETRENKENFISIDHFKNYWQPVILPETVSKRKRPEYWRIKDDKLTRGEDIRWNTGYTQRTFPEELWPVRDTGTLLRDWEEALPWIYMEYHMDYIVELLSGEITFTKIK